MNALMVFVRKGRCVPVVEISSKPTSDQFKHWEHSWLGHLNSDLMLLILPVKKCRDFSRSLALDITA